MDSHDVAKMENVAYVFGMAAGGMIQAMGMHAENQDRLQNGNSIAYLADDFDKIVEERGLHHNGILTAFGR